VNAPGQLELFAPPAEQGSGEHAAPDPVLEEVYRLAEEGLTVREVAQRVGRSPGTVGRYLGAWRRDNGKPLQPSRTTEIVRDAAGHREVTVSELADATGLRHDTVRRALQRLGAVSRAASGGVQTWRIVPAAADDLSDLDAARARCEESTAHAEWLAKVGVRAVPRCRCVEGPAVWASVDDDPPTCARCGTAPA
jgi:hypothetical protein